MPGLATSDADNFDNLAKVCPSEPGRAFWAAYAERARVGDVPVPRRKPTGRHRPRRKP